MSHQNPILASIAARRGRVTPAEVAADTGKGVRMCARVLNRIAVACGGAAHIEASPAGEAVYVFPRNLTGAFAATRMQETAGTVMQALLHLVTFLFRCSFGLLLIASFICVLSMCIATFAVLVIFATVTGIHVHGEIHHLLQQFDFHNLGYFFSWRERDSKEEQYIYLGQAIDFRSDGLLYNCYSYLFGDGDPNAHLKLNDEWMRNIAALIYDNQGAISWGQVVPLLVSPTVPEEKAIFPLLVRFDGLPQVNAAGKIIYVFPEMQSTDKPYPPAPAYVEETEWLFTEEPASKMRLVVIFGLFNLAGWCLIANSPGLCELVSPYQWIIPIFAEYAAFFLLFPVQRHVANSMRNAAVDGRNQLRRKAAEKLAPPAVPGGRGAGAAGVAVAAGGVDLARAHAHASQMLQS